MRRITRPMTSATTADARTGNSTFDWGACGWDCWGLLFSMYDSVASLMILRVRSSRSASRRSSSRASFASYMAGSASSPSPSTVSRVVFASILAMEAAKALSCSFFAAPSAATASSLRESSSSSVMVTG